MQQSSFVGKVCLVVWALQAVTGLYFVVSFIWFKQLLGFCAMDLSFPYVSGPLTSAGNSKNKNVPVKHMGAL